MDENTAWSRFVMTGRVSDYLNYCRIKLGYPPQETETATEDDHENEYRGSGSDESGRWR